MPGAPAESSPMVGITGERLHYGIECIAHGIPYRCDEQACADACLLLSKQTQSERPAQAVPYEDRPFIHVVRIPGKVIEPFPKNRLVRMWKIWDDWNETSLLQFGGEPRKPVLLGIATRAMEEKDGVQSQKRRTIYESFSSVPSVVITSSVGCRVSRMRDEQ